jgi:hypothetical protein
LDFNGSFNNCGEFGHMWRGWQEKKWTRVEKNVRLDAKILSRQFSTVLWKEQYFVTQNQMHVWSTFSRLVRERNRPAAELKNAESVEYNCDSNNCSIERIERLGVTLGKTATIGPLRHKWSRTGGCRAHDFWFVTSDSLSSHTVIAMILCICWVL